MKNNQDARLQEALGGLVSLTAPHVRPLRLKCGNARAPALPSP